MKELLRKIMPEALWNWCRQRAKDVVLWYILPPVYKRACKQTEIDKNRALFVEMNSPSMSENMVHVAHMLEEDYGMQIEFWSLRAHSVGLIKRTRNMAELAKRAASAHYIFICEAMNMLACLPLRPKTKIVQLWHGCGAFKRFGMSTADKKFGDNRRDKLRHPYHTNTALVTVSSPEVVWAYEEAMEFKSNSGIVRPLGVSRTDIYFDTEYLAALKEQVYEQVPACRSKRVVLYAPTFRGRVATAQAPDQLDLMVMRHMLGQEWVLLIKHHQHIKQLPSIPEECQDFAFDVTDELSIEALMAAADVCISDYSSLVFEYSLLNRPMAFFAYDLQDYDDWRGFYYSYDELTPGPIFAKTQDLAEWILHMDERFDVQEVHVFRERFMGSCDGRATKRICQAALAL